MNSSMIDLSKLRDRPLFICGHPKAGTSLARAVFDFASPVSGFS